MGSSGSGKLDAAWALAQALLCGHDEVPGDSAACDDSAPAARRAARRAMVRALDSLSRADEAEILASGKELMGAVKARLADVASTMKGVLDLSQV